MGITINGSSAAGNIDLGTNGTITDLAVGGLPDGTVDADTLASGAVSVGGATGTDYNDSVKVRFGTGNDLAIYHNGTDAVIDAEDAGATRTLILKGGTTSDRRIELQSSDGEPHIRCAANSYVQLYHDNAVAAYTGATGLHVQGTDNRLTFHDDTDTHIQRPAANTIAFTCAGGEAGRFDGDGALCIGRTDKQSGSTNLSVQGVNVHPVEVKRTGTGDQGMIGFYNDNGMVGSIETNGSATEYNTSSDYRMKENVTALTGAATRLKTLKPYRFNFKTDSSKTVDGFFAHEVATAVPEAISGAKDAVVTQAKIHLGIYNQSQLNDPVYQGIDQSKLVPLLVAALQEALTRIEALEAA